MHETGARCDARPFLFLLQVKYLTKNVQGTKLVLFADDTNLLITRTDLFDLQHTIINIMS
jgi:hypothetical protein